MLHELDLDMLPFVGEALTQLRQEVGDNSAVLGGALTRSMQQTQQLESAWFGFNPRTYQVKNWYRNANATCAATPRLRGRAVVGLCTLNQVDP